MLKALGIAPPSWVSGTWDAAEETSHAPWFDYWFGIPYSNDMKFEGRPGIEELFMMQQTGKQKHSRSCMISLSPLKTRTHRTTTPSVGSHCDEMAVDDLLEQLPSS